MSELKRSNRTRTAVVISCIVLATASLVLLLQVNQSAEAGILTPVGGSGTEETLFSDDFSNETYTSESWTVQSGTWAVELGEYSQIEEPVGRRMSAAGQDWTDYVYEARVKMFADQYAGLLFRYQDVNNYYMWYLRGPSNTVRLRYRKGGVEDWLGSTTSMSIDTNQWYTLKVAVEGSNIKCYVDGIEYIDLVDTQLTQGRIALFSDLTHVHFDDVNVTRSGLEPTAYNLNVRAEVTQIVITSSWSGSGNITIANLTSPTTTYYESDMSIYEKTTVSTGGTTSIFNIRRATLPIAAPATPETWTLYLNLTDVNTYQVSAELS